MAGTARSYAGIWHSKWRNLATWLADGTGVNIRAGAYMPRAAQEYALEAAAAQDARVTEVEQGLVAVTLALARRPGVLHEAAAAMNSPGQVSSNPGQPDNAPRSTTTTKS